MDLKDKECVACRGDLPRLESKEQKAFLQELKDWKIDPDGHLSKRIELADFLQSLALANRIGQTAEAAGHHPDLLVRWGELVVTIWTHKVGGLTESDFVLAAKIDQLL